MPLADLDPVVRRRVDSAWRDPDVWLKDIRARFSLSLDDLSQLRRELGPKPRAGVSSAQALSSQRRYRRRMAEAAR